MSIGVALVAAAFLCRWMLMPDEDRSQLPPVGVLGDSDSHSYHDTVSFPPGGTQRGGAWRATTFQWVEVLDRLRGRELDPGQWSLWGTRRSLSRLAELVRIPYRVPQREDYRFNLSMSGAGCDDLLAMPTRQAYALRSHMDADPARWAKGVVVIKIGVNSFGQPPHLNLLARDPSDAATLGTLRGCVDTIRRTVALLRERHPRTGIVLVGIFDNTNWPRFLGRWTSPAERARIAAAFDAFDDGLAQIARSDGRAIFFSDRQWFASTWGGRAADGSPDYRPVRIGGLTVTNSEGDEPTNALLKDGHAGLVWNVLWLRALVERLRNDLGVPVTPISDAEADAFVSTTIAPGPTAR